MPALLWLLLCYGSVRLFEHDILGAAWAHRVATKVVLCPRVQPHEWGFPTLGVPAWGPYDKGIYISGALHLVT